MLAIWCKVLLKEERGFLCLEQESHMIKVRLQNAHSDVTENDEPVRGAVCAGRRSQMGVVVKMIRADEGRSKKEGPPSSLHPSISPPLRGLSCEMGRVKPRRTNSLLVPLPLLRKGVVSKASRRSRLIQRPFSGLRKTRHQYLER